ncbi:MAG: hypothetical protein QW745_05620 [Thermoplasmata archaeon]|uniref:hypothetical protein n=1 Tax=Sulfolobaceae TaxID=118883 RepID=UPI003182A26F
MIVEAINPNSPKRVIYEGMPVTVKKYLDSKKIKYERVPNGFDQTVLFFEGNPQVVWGDLFVRSYYNPKFLKYVARFYPSFDAVYLIMPHSANEILDEQASMDLPLQAFISIYKYVDRATKAYLNTHFNAYPLLVSEEDH